MECSNGGDRRFSSFKKCQSFRFEAEREKVSAESVRVNERTETLVFFFVFLRRGFSFSEVGRRAGRGWARAAGA